MKRRELLGSAAVVGAPTLSGCAGVLPFGRSTTKLARLSVVNWDEDAAQTVDVRVERDGTVVHESTHTVGQMQGNEAQATVVDCTWDDVPGEYVVAARLAGDSDWRTFDLLDATEQSPSCVIAAVQYGQVSGIDEQQPLNIEVRDRCDEVGENYEGGCPAYLSNGSQ